MGPSIYDVHTKIGFLAPFPCPHASTCEPDPPCGRPHAVQNNYPFSWNFFGFWVSGRQILYISLANISNHRRRLVINIGVGKNLGHKQWRGKNFGEIYFQTKNLEKVPFYSPKNY